MLTEPELVQSSEAFEAAIAGGDRDTLASFCAGREAALGGGEEAETWAFLATHFAADGRKYLLERLGFSEFLPAEPEPEPEPQPEQAEGVPGGDEAAAAAEQMGQLGLDPAAAAAQLMAGDGSDFFASQGGWLRAEGAWKHVLAVAGGLQGRNPMSSLVQATAGACGACTLATTPLRPAPPAPPSLPFHRPGRLLRQPARRRHAAPHLAAVARRCRGRRQRHGRRAAQPQGGSHH